MMQNDKRLGKLHNVLTLIDQKVRYIVLELNQHKYITFTSCEGHSDTELPKIGILCKDLAYAINLIHYLETLDLNVWYELSNRWLCTNGSEINTSDKINRETVLSELELNWSSCYFLIMKTKTLDDLKRLGKLLCQLQ
jgi:hypothetical protein